MKHMNNNSDGVKQVLPARVKRKSVPIAPNVLPTREWTDLDIAFMAGAFWGEGSMGGRGVCPRAAIDQKDPELLFKFREFLGGSISHQVVIAEGTNLSADAHIYRLMVCGDKARRFLQAIYPYMDQRRKKQIENTGALIIPFDLSKPIHCMTESRRASRVGMTFEQKQYESQKDHYERHPEKLQAHYRKYEDLNLEKNRAQRREYMRKLRASMTEEDREKRRIYKRNLYEQNKNKHQNANLPSTLSVSGANSEVIH